MKVQFNRQALVDALGLLVTVVPSRTSKPILKCMRINAGADSVEMSATDTEVGITTRMTQAQVDEPGELVLDADRIAGIVRESSDDVLVFESQDNACKITGADSTFTVYGQDATQFPFVAGGEGQSDVEVSLEQLQFGAKQVLFATAKESSRYAINGVLWEMKAKKMTMIATDGRRLAKTRISLLSAAPDSWTNQKIIVSAKTMLLIEKIASEGKETVGIRLVGNQIVFHCGAVVISSNLVEGAFPKHEDIIPGDYTNRLTLKTEAVLSAVRRASLLAIDESRGIKLSIASDSLVFSGRAPDAGAAVIQMPIEYKGAPMQIGFNPQFLADALRVIHTPEFDLELGQSDRPGMIKSGSDFLYVLMPINLA